MAQSGVGLNYIYNKILNALKTKGRCKYISPLLTASTWRFLGVKLKEEIMKIYLV